AFFALMLGLIPAYISWRKGDSFLKMWVFGTLLFVIALPVAIFEKPNQNELDRRRMAKGEVRCPFCREFVNVDAIVCPHCRRDIKPPPSINACVSQAEMLSANLTHPQPGMSRPRSDEISNQPPEKARKRVPGAVLVIGGIAVGLVVCSPVFYAAYLSRVEEQQRSSTPHGSALDDPPSSSNQ